jgi:WD40 repeat protein
MRSQRLFIFLAVILLLVGCNPHSEIVLGLSPLISGNGVTSAAIYDSSAPGPHRVFLLDASGDPHKWTSKLPEEWLPSDVNSTELVALIEAESEILLGTQAYAGGPSISRYRYEIGIQIMEANTGTVLWDSIIKGSEPPGFPSVAPKSQTTLHGDRVSSADLIEWLSCKVTSINCEMNTLEGPEGSISLFSITFSPDGQTLAAIPVMFGDGEPGTMKRGGRGVAIWRLNNGLLVDYFKSEISTRGVAYSPDGSILAVRAADGTLYLWRTDDGSLIRTMEGLVDDREYCDLYTEIYELIFSSDGQYLTVGGCAGAEYWRISDGKLLNQIPIGGSSHRYSRVSSDGQLFAVRTSSDALIYRVSTGELIPFPWFDSRGVAFSPSGQMLAVGTNRSSPRNMNFIELGQISDSVLQREFDLMDADGSKQNIAMAFSPDGQLLATKQDAGDLEIWQVENGTLFLTLEELVYYRYLFDTPELEFSPDGQFLAFTNGSNDGAIHFWFFRKNSEK